MYTSLGSSGTTLGERLGVRWGVGRYGPVDEVMMEAPQVDRDTREKLEKIQRLMEGAGTVGEAEAAASAMQRLLIKHNIDASELESFGKRDHEEYEAVVIQVGPKNSQGLQWRLNLVRVLAEHGFCTFIRIGMHGGVGYIVGQRSNIEAVQLLFTATVETVERLANQDWPSFRNRFNDWHQVGCPTSVAWKNSYKIGFAAGLWRKLHQEKQALEAGDVTTSALVVVKDAELSAAVDRTIGKTVMRRESRASNSDGFGRGFSRGMEHEVHGRLDG